MPNLVLAGKNLYGTVGDNTTIDRSAPTLVLGGHTWSHLYGGYRHICGLTTTGAALCWGLNYYGGHLLLLLLWQLMMVVLPLPCPALPCPALPCPALPSPTTTIIHPPTHPPHPTPPAHPLTHSPHHPPNHPPAGQLGDNTTTDQHMPVDVVGGYTFSQLAPGYYHTCGLLLGGSAVCWGQNGQGRTGTGYPPTSSLTVPTAVLGGLSFASLAAGQYHTCGLLLGDGSAYCFGKRREEPCTMCA